MSDAQFCNANTMHGATSGGFASPAVTLHDSSVGLAEPSSPLNSLTSTSSSTAPARASAATRSRSGLGTPRPSAHATTGTSRASFVPTQKARVRSRATAKPEYRTAASPWR